MKKKKFQIFGVYIALVLILCYIMFFVPFKYKTTIDGYYGSYSAALYNLPSFEGDIEEKCRLKTDKSEYVFVTDDISLTVAEVKTKSNIFKNIYKLKGSSFRLSELTEEADRLNKLVFRKSLYGKSPVMWAISADSSLEDSETQKLFSFSYNLKKYYIYRKI